MQHASRSFPLLVLAAGIHNANATVNPDTVTMVRGSGSIAINVLANDIPDPPAERYTLQRVDTFSVAYGSVIRDEENDQVIYQPPSDDFVGTDTFFYDAIDEFGYGGSAMVTINVVQPALDSLARGATNKAIARVMDDLCAPIPSDGDGEVGLSGAAAINVNAIAVTPDTLSDACSTLAQAAQDGDQFNSYLREIAPEEALIQRDLLAKNSRNKTSRLYRSMAQMRSGNNTSISINGTSLPFGGAAGDSLGSPWTLLSAFQIENFDHDITVNEAGYDSDALGIMVGLGYRLSATLNMGGALDWTSYDVGYDGNSGDLDSDIYSLTGFLSWYRNAWGVDLQAGYSQGSTQAQRRFAQLEISEADSDYDSSQLDLSSQVDWSWQHGAWSLKPFLRLDYLKTTVDAYSETGTASWLVEAEKQTHEQLDSSAGLDTSYTLSYSWGVMIPAIKLSFVNQANLSNSPVAFQLIGVESDSGRFELRADSPDSLFYQWDLSTAFVLANGLSTFIGGQLLSGYDGVSVYQVNGGINWEF